MIEETIRRNASPVRFDENASAVIGAGSCSSLASSGSDEVLPRASRSTGIVQSVAQSTFGVPTHNTNQFTGKYLQKIFYRNYCSCFIHNYFVFFNLGNQTHSHKSRNIANAGNQVLLHSLSTNDATLGEYKYTVNVGQNSLKITGDCFDLVRVSLTFFLYRLRNN